MQANGLYNQGSPLVGQQPTNPPEPLSGKDALHPPLETLRGQPDTKTVGETESENNGRERFHARQCRLHDGPHPYLRLIAWVDAQAVASVGRRAM
jgi:hypothetical protein